MHFGGEAAITAAFAGAKVGCYPVIAARASLLREKKVRGGRGGGVMERFSRFFVTERIDYERRKYGIVTYVVVMDMVQLPASVYFLVAICTQQFHFVQLAYKNVYKSLILFLQMYVFIYFC